MWTYTHTAALKPTAQTFIICILACRDKAGKLGLNFRWMFALELIKKAFLACRKLVTKPVCVYYWLSLKALTPVCVLLHMCLSVCILHSLLDPGPECADYQSLQWISSAGCGCGAATHRTAPGHCGGKDTHAHTIMKRLWLHLTFNTLIHVAVFQKQSLQTFYNQDKLYNTRNYWTVAKIKHECCCWGG